jgi:hypothetical protein
MSGLLVFDTQKIVIVVTLNFHRMFLYKFVIDGIIFFFSL